MILDSIVTPWEDPKEDLLDRKKYAEFLTGYLANQESSFVLNLNASWGAGKTYFLKNWCKSLEGKYPTVYVNAWKDDFSDDPLLAILASINEQLAQYYSKNKKTLKQFKDKLNIGGRFLRGLLPIIVKGVANKALGDKAGEDLSDLITDKSISEMTSESMKMMLANHESTSKSVIEFRDALESIVEEITNNGLKVPLFIFIDELDRCRPTYAIELLEMVKHLFDAKGIIFIIATDSEQLQHSIKAVYGNDFNGSEYLRRFFDQEYTLPTPDYSSYCQYLVNTFQHADKLEYWNFHPWSLSKSIGGEPTGWGSQDSLKMFLILYVEYFNLSLRSINQVIVRLDAILSNSDTKWDAPFLLFLLVSHAKDKDIFKRLRAVCNRGQVKHDQALFDVALQSKGKKIRWLSYDKYGGGDDDTWLNVRDICYAYAGAIGQIKISAHDALVQQANFDGNNLSQFLLRELSHKKLDEKHRFPDLSLYYDSVEMAGALS